jgi:hypothetical protein
MTESAADMARLMNVVEAIVAELERQGVADAVADLGFDPMPMAQAVIRRPMVSSFPSRGRAVRDRPIKWLGRRSRVPIWAG